MIRQLFERKASYEAEVLAEAQALIDDGLDLDFVLDLFPDEADWLAPLLETTTGIAGAMMMASATLDLSAQTFIDRLLVSLNPRHYLIGLAKAPVFALFIAVIGCRMGMTVSRDTRSIGIHTTSTVVQGIVAVILLDALFAVLFMEIDF